MPVRSLKQSVWRWPAAEQVRWDVQAWPKQQQQRVSSMQRLGVFGSYGRGTGLDLILVDSDGSEGQLERLQQWPFADLPLSCDSLVLTLLNWSNA